MNQLKFFKTGFYILLGLNIAWMFFFIVSPKPPTPRGGFTLKSRIIEQLKLDEGQQKKYLAMTVDHHEAMVASSQSIQKLTRAYFKTLVKADSLEKMSIFREIEREQMQRLKLTYEHFEEIKSLCSEKQLKEFPGVVSHGVNLIFNQSEKGPLMK